MTSDLDADVNASSQCDGKHPTCLSCENTKSECHYVLPAVKNRSEQRLYIRALEERVAELESGLSYDGRIGVADDHWERLRPREDSFNDLAGAIRELSLNASGYYVGTTTHIALGRMLGVAIQGHPSSKPSHPVPNVEQHADKDRQATQASGPGPAPDILPPLEGVKPPKLSLFARDEAEVLFQSYMKSISTLYPIVHSKRLRGIHARREKLQDLWEVSVLHFVYAIGGRSLELNGQPGNYFCDLHYDAAMECRDAIIQYIDRRSIIFLLYATLYCLRAPRAPGPWLMLGLAMKLCTGVGLHRKSAGQTLCLASELDKRLFWTCYHLDQDVCLSTGRPTNISDFHIDVSLPLDIDEDTVTLEDFRRAARQNPEVPANPPTSLTGFVHTLRLKRIQSEIQQTIYRVDRPTNPTHDMIEGLLAKLAKWQQDAPTDTNDHAAKGFSMIQYSLSVRVVLFPQLSEDPVNQHYLQLCADACVKVCETYKRLHHKSNSISYTPLATQWLFLSGLTLIYCIWHSPTLVLTSASRSAVYSCSTMLYVMTERWPAAARYRDAFEGVKDSVFELISSRPHEPRSVVEGVDMRMRSALDTQDPVFPGSTMRQQAGFGQMLDDIMGEGQSHHSQAQLQGGWPSTNWGIALDNLGATISGSYNFTPALLGTGLTPASGEGGLESPNTIETAAARNHANMTSTSTFEDGSSIGWAVPGSAINPQSWDVNWNSHGDVRM
ncbi:hypothetical protein A1O1_05060 [Capronia coronata CBS 617.96]|uniref:Xylanolytic transcriptional activator regulatory domain-containing protein n=1 Tax=Capronia coronata CBS 617.96 TaxID=1182541 RepID=W9Y5M6_9EURO|nr:uncharacterized protein A1O1_05060 [Capronia coronata CBS 617.96]EXJ88132.1 hypothetical protein A1O1_05060 [Capronia coronata CBS 617.96]